MNKQPFYAIQIQYYLPAAKNYIKREMEKGASGVRIVNSQHYLKNKWEKIKFGEVQMKSVENGYLFQVNVLLNDINPKEVLVELYAEDINGSTTLKINMGPDLISVDRGEHIFHVQVTFQRPANDYTAPIIPNYQGISLPLENNLILWQR
jgi:glycogen phosphorylase